MRENNAQESFRAVLVCDHSLTVSYYYSDGIWSAFLHSIQLNETLAPTMDFTGAVKMAALKFHLNLAGLPAGQQFVLRKLGEKKNVDGQCTVNLARLSYVAHGPPLRWPGSALPAVPSSQRTWAQCGFWLGWHWDRGVRIEVQKRRTQTERGSVGWHKGSHG